MLPQWLSSKESTCNSGTTGDARSIHGLGRVPGEWNGNPLQDSCLENPMDRGAWQATVHGVVKSRTWLKWLSTHTDIYGHQEGEPCLIHLQATYPNPSTLSCTTIIPLTSTLSTFPSLCSSHIGLLIVAQTQGAHLSLKTSVSTHPPPRMLF